MENHSEWSFDNVKYFDSHIGLSIPNFESIDWIIKSLATHFVEKNTNVYDLGTSTGRLIKYLAKHNEVDGVSFIGYDISTNLLQQVNSDELSLFIRDVTDPSLKLFNTNLIVSVFLLQFIERNKRHILLNKIYDSLNPGGAFIVFEKVYSEYGIIESIIHKTHYDYKRQHFNNDELFKKEDTLRTIMRPLSVSDNEIIFNNIGFKTEMIWRSLNFVGWICIK